jgi:hypothetical protein
MAKAGVSKAGVSKAGAKRPKPGRAGAAQKTGGGLSLTWLLGVMCGAVLAFATPTAVLAVVLLAPAILVSVFDHQPGRPATRVVFIAGAGLTFGPVWHLNAASPSIAAALDMLCDPAVLCPAWLAGALSWGVCEFLPLMLHSVAERKAAARMKALLEEARALNAQWDLGR